MTYSTNAEKQMLKRSITKPDVEAVLAHPTKELPGDDGCINRWGYGPSNKRIRVTFNPTTNVIVTVANADSRIKQ